LSGGPCHPSRFILGFQSFIAGNNQPMPTLFISYKRKTTSVAPLMERLKAAQYRLWFDIDEIRLGDADWRVPIQQGIERSDGLILCITPLACQSEPVREEVRQALALKKPIFAVILEPTNRSEAITALGLPSGQQIEDFTDVPNWDKNIQRLLDALVAKGLRVTHHDKRQERDPNNPAYTLHQRYLRRLVEQVGTLNLALISPEQTSGINLEDVYVDSPTPLLIRLEMENGQVIDWWLRRSGESSRELPGENKEPHRPKPEEYGYERAPLEALVGKLAVEQLDNTEIHLHLKHLAAARNRLVILGTPGSGKSTFVRYLALCLAGTGIEGWTRGANLTSLENWPHGTLTPVYVELRRFVTSTYFPPTGTVTAEHLWKYIENELLGEELKEYARDLRNELEQGYGLLILDGLDEVPYDERKLKERQTQLSGLAQSLQTRFGGSRIIVTSRPYAYEGWNLPGFEAVSISEFTDKHRQELAERLYRVSGLREEEAKTKAEALNEQLEEIDEELKDRPLFVTLMATLYLKQGFNPEREGTE